ncbi:MAG: class I SAM-dependent methyltransferase, partial [Hyphomonadaceae bacterium]|nr:class I SAM-dependent methyltransferase [Hyphomonadaceae bacterium]
MAEAAIPDVPCGHCGAQTARPLFEKHGYRLVRCTKCNLAYIANPPGEAELAHVYSNDAGYHDQLLDPASAAHAEMTAVARRHLAVLRREATAGTLLDVGASVGLFVAAAQAAGFNARGVEFNAASAGYARETLGLDVSAGTLDKVDIARDSLDIVTMFDVIEHLRDPLEAMQQVRALLRPGGLFLLSTPDIDGWFPRLSYL